MMSIGLLAGLLAGGRYYPNSGLSAFDFHAFGAAPLLIPLAAFLPGKRRWMRGLLALLLTSAAVWPIAIPAALEAKRVAEMRNPISSLNSAK